MMSLYTQTVSFISFIAMIYGKCPVVSEAGKTFAWPCPDKRVYTHHYQYPCTLTALFNLGHFYLANLKPYSYTLDYSIYSWNNSILYRDGYIKHFFVTIRHAVQPMRSLILLEFLYVGAQQKLTNCARLHSLS